MKISYSEIKNDCGKSVHKTSNYFAFTCLLDSKEMLQVSEVENNISSTKHTKLNEA